jgi:transcriptional regulator with XRE-family HTH domain
MRTSELKTRLARARVTAGLTQVEFAKVSGIGIDQIRHLERGGPQGRHLTLERVAGFAQILGVSGSWLSGLGDEHEPVALDGEPYTRAKYLEHRARGLPLPGVKVEKMNPKTKAFFAQRAQAWKDYLTRIINDVFDSPAAYSPFPLGQERVGLEILTPFRPPDQKMWLPRSYTVDTIMRDMRAEQHKKGSQSSPAPAASPSKL